jgi:hypothetical protein
MAGTDPDTEVGLTDYLLGQADPIGRADVARHLQSDGDAHELAEKLVAQLKLIAPSAELPQLPAGRGAKATPDTEAGATGEPKEGFAASLTHRQRQLIAALLGGGLVVVIIVLIATGAFSGGSGGSGGQGSSTASTTPDRITQAQLTPVGGGNARGIALFEQAQKVGPVLSIKLFGLPKTSAAQRYGFWLAGNRFAVPLNGAKEDSRGAIKATVPIPVEYLAFLQKQALTSVAVTRLTAAQMSGAARTTVDLIKALKAGRTKAAIPNLVGQVVVQGSITGPGFTTPAGTTGSSGQSGSGTTGTTGGSGP